MTDAVRYDRKGPIAVLTLANPPVNALGAAVRQGLFDHLAKAFADDAVSAVVVVGDGRCFCGGADIKEFSAPRTDVPTLRHVIDRIERSTKPVVAAVHGFAFGGGLELAMGCHYRLAEAGAQVGQPEVKLGIIPGAGGTQRLPRLIGAKAALEIILSGDPVSAKTARIKGIVDDLPVGNLMDAALQFAGDNLPLRRARDLVLRDAEPEVFAAARKKIERRARGLMAPWRCIDAVENAANMDFDAAMAKEREYFVECRDSEQSKGQRHVFFAVRAAAKIPDVPRETAAKDIAQAGVIGCGTMGRGIAMSFANAGIPVKILEADPDALRTGLDAIAATYRASAAKGRLSEADKTARLGLISGATEYADMCDADIVVEAVFEDMEVKKQVFTSLDPVCKPGVVMATNTSTLDVDEIAGVTARPGSVIGTHFFSPANVMRLMENVRGGQTSPETIATVMKLSKRLGKIGVLVGICDGFVGNRMYHCYTRQASFLLEEGALPEQVDKVLYDFGFAMGPFAVGDVAGLDISWRIRQRRAETRPAHERYSPIADRLCEQGRFGQKTGAGWYCYEDGSRVPKPDPEVEAVILAVSKELGIARRPIGDDEIRQRCLFAMVNEGAKILEEGLALRSSDIDVIWIYGYGFPIQRGGPMFCADQIGLPAVLESLKRFEQEQGELMKPAALLEDLVRDGKGFGDLT